MTANLKAHVLGEMVILLMLLLAGSAIAADCVTMGATCLDPVVSDSLQARIPIILVHGWNPDSIPAPSLTETWDNFIAYFNQNPSLYNQFKLYRLSYNSNSVTVPELGRAFRDVIDKMSADDPLNFGSKPQQIAGRRILLIDDVMTTGATVAGAAQTLMKAGARSVSVLTAARVVR
jgi:predicted phosphoribosyltransferase